MKYSHFFILVGTLFLSTTIIHAQFVGVGTVVPTETLDINGDLKVRGNDIYSIENLRLRAGGTGYVELQTQSSIWGVIIRDKDDNDYGNIETTAAGLGIGYNTGSAQITISPEFRVGIRTTTPRAALEIVDDGATHPALLIRGASGSEGDITYLSNEALQIGSWDATAETFAEVMRMTPSLKVGIGTTNPLTALHVFGTESDGITSAALTVGNGTQQMLLDGNEIDASNGTLYIQRNATHDLVLGTGGGNVGVGLNLPTSKLHVYGAENDGTTAAFTVASGSQKIIMDGNELDGNGSIFLQNNSANNLYLVNGGGKVGIGLGGAALVGGYKLYVADGIMTERVRVAIEGSAQWADYVFADNYHLTSLEEVDKFVSKNKHLPNIPSAQTVAEEGIDLGKMDARLLEKIEELFLHSIDLNNENKALKEELDAIKKRLSNLEK